MCGSRTKATVAEIDVQFSPLLSFRYNQEAMGFALTLSPQADDDDSYIL